MAAIASSSGSGCASTFLFSSLFPRSRTSKKASDTHLLRRRIRPTPRTTTTHANDDKHHHHNNNKKNMTTTRRSATTKEGDAAAPSGSNTATTSTTTTSTSSPGGHKKQKIPTAPDTPLQAAQMTTGGREPPPPTPSAATRKNLQRARIASAPGFIAALDQSGGSTPRALGRYGITDIRGDSEDMYRLIHDMRSRIITSRAFTGDRIIGAILFEDTVLNRRIEGVPTATYLWEEKNVVPFLKIDKGLEPEKDGVQLMKNIPRLTELLDACGKDTYTAATATAPAAPAEGVDTAAAAQGGDGSSAHGPFDCVFGTKARSVIRHANVDGIKAVVAQQFAVASEVLAAGLVPIVEPEVDIGAEDKTEAETILQRELMFHLGSLSDGEMVCLKLTPPEEPETYTVFNNHPNVLRVFALSGGYSREEAAERLKACVGMSASFSRALTEGLKVNQTPEVFDATLDNAVRVIFEASLT